MNTLDAIKSRRSTRDFSEKAVDGGLLKTILDAGACAPVGAGVEVSYSVVRNKAVLKKLTDLAVAAMKKEPGYDPFYGASTVVILSAAPHPVGCDLANAACAAENILIAAADAGVDSIYLLGFALGLKGDAQLQKEAGIPEGNVPLLGIALGYSKSGPGQPRATENKKVTYID